MPRIPPAPIAPQRGTEAPHAAIHTQMGQFVRTPCRHFDLDACSGCTRLDHTYDDQCTEKARHVRERLSEVSPGIVIRPLLRSPETLGYRVSAKLCLNEDRFGKKSVGFYRRDGKRVVHALNCPAQHRDINGLVQKLFRDLRRVPFKFYDHAGRVFQRGRLKFLTLRCSPRSATSSTRFGLIISHTGIDQKEFVAWIKRVDPNLCVYETLLSQRDGDKLTGKSVRHLTGPTTMTFPLYGTTFELAPDAFFQANLSLSDALIREATTFDTEGEALLDLYSGFGAYTLVLARRFKSVTSVDGSAAAIKALAAAAQAAGLPGVKAIASMCEDFLASSEAGRVAENVTHMIVNPPRGGLSRRVASALTSEAFPKLRELNYVSCNPVTLARDAAHLKAQGLVLKSATPLDMFPQTDHVEVVARFSRA